MIKVIRRISFRPLRLMIWSLFFVFYFYPIWMIKARFHKKKFHRIALAVNHFMWSENAKKNNS